MTSKADQNRKNAYTRASVRAKVEEAAGGSSVILYALDDKSAPFEFPHPYFYTKELRAALEDEDVNEGEVLLGEQEYARFLAEGGTDDEISLFTIAVGRDIQARQANPKKG